MLINNIDISNFGAILSDKQIQNSIININNEWLKKSFNYCVTSITNTFKTIKLTLNFIASDENTILKNISDFYSQLNGICTIQFNGINYWYDCIYSGGSSNSDVTKYTNENYEISITLLSGYAYQDYVTQTLSNASSTTFTVNGNLPTPCVLTLTPSADAKEITIGGFGDNIIVNNVKANIPIVIDGENCLITMGGANKFNDITMWDFPSLNAGSNTITVNNITCNLTIKYKPKWI